MRRLMILIIALAVSGAAASLWFAQFTDDGPVAEVHKPLHPAGRQPSLGGRLAAWLQPKLG